MDRKLPKRLIALCALMILVATLGLGSVLFFDNDHSSIVIYPSWLSWMKAWEKPLAILQHAADIGIAIALLMGLAWSRITFNIYVLVTSLGSMVLNFLVTINITAGQGLQQDLNFSEIYNSTGMKFTLALSTLLILSVMLWIVNCEKSRRYLSPHQANFIPTKEEIAEASAMYQQDMAENKDES